MAELNIETNSMKECGKDMINLSIELNEAFNNLFIELESLESNRAWNGNAAQHFVDMIRMEKVDYYDMKNSLLKIGEFFEKSGEKYDQFILENKR